MPAPGVIKNNQEIIVCSSYRDVRISPSLPTPIPLEHVLMPYGFQKKGDQLPPFKPLPMSSAEMVSMLQSALDIMESSDYWSDITNGEVSKQGRSSD
jgi:hypothetical protein